MKVNLEVAGELAIPDHIFFPSGAFKTADAFAAQNLLCARAFAKRWPSSVTLDKPLRESLQEGTILLTHIDAIRTECLFESLLDIPFLQRNQYSLPEKTIVSNVVTRLRNDAILTRQFAQRTYVLGDQIKDNFNLKYIYGTVWREILYVGERFVGLPSEDHGIGRVAVGWVQSSG
jgi:hypothetical protein